MSAAFRLSYFEFRISSYEFLASAGFFDGESAVASF